MEKRCYVTTDRAGFTVACTPIPATYVEGKEPRPMIGFELMLTDAEAEFELAQGTIMLKPETVKSARKIGVESA